jgi:hypothetical protein
MVQAIPRIDEIDREATQSYVERNFSAQVMAKHYTQVYAKVIATRKNLEVTQGGKGR